MNSLSDTSVKHLQKFPKNLERLFSSGLEGFSGFETPQRDTGFDCYPGSEIRQNLGTDAGLGKKTIFGTVADADLEISGVGGGGSSRP